MSAWGPFLQPDLRVNASAPWDAHQFKSLHGDVSGADAAQDADLPHKFRRDILISHDFSRRCC